MERACGQVNSPLRTLKHRRRWLRLPSFQCRHTLWDADGIQTSTCKSREDRKGSIIASTVAHVTFVKQRMMSTPRTHTHLHCHQSKAGRCRRSHPGPSPSLKSWRRSASLWGTKAHHSACTNSQLPCACAAEAGWSPAQESRTSRPTPPIEGGKYSTCAVLCIRCA